MEECWEALTQTLSKFVPSAHDFMLQHKLIQLGTTATNLPLNRYCNIIPFDFTLVSLKSQSYLNASIMNIPNITQPFIIAQCPMHPLWYGPDTTNEFWEMICEHSISTIVNLAKIEKGFGGASLYWPLHEGEIFSCNSYQIKCIHAETLEEGCLIRRKLSVSPLSAACSNTENDSHYLNHYHFTQWPNYDVANSTNSTKLLLNYVLEERMTTMESNAATVVHCSGGVGRSGTFVTAISAIEQLRLEKGRTGEKEGKDEKNGKEDSVIDTSTLSLRLYDIVKILREQRHPWMVEGNLQFLFCKRIVEETIAQNENDSQEVQPSSRKV
jgi:protein tyrosine phosphatase